jgi:hypothetical protein
LGALAALAFTLAGIHIGTQSVLPVGYAPAWSPDGARIAFVTRGDLRVADADGTHLGLIARAADNPAWAPNGRRIAFSRDDAIWTVRVDGTDERELARGAHPAWTPDGKRIAFDRDGKIYSLLWQGGDLRLLATGEQPAFSPTWRLALVRDGQVMIGGTVVDEGTQPAWAPDSTRLAYVRDGRIYVDRRAVSEGTQPAWRPPKRVAELLPDLDQRPPSDLTVARGDGQWRLGFTSLVDNVGFGAAMIVGRRPPGFPMMIAAQRVRLTNGRSRVYPEVGLIRYVSAGNHHHWHLLRFDTYELRRLDGALLVRDRKSGFCLADHYGIAPGTFVRHARFLGNCKQYNPDARSVVQGTSVGYTDRYPAFFHGQAVSITGVPAGDYVVVHRANPNLGLHELRYENNAASVRIRLTWPNGVPSVRVLRRCAASASC